MPSALNLAGNCTQKCYSRETSCCIPRQEVTCTSCNPKFITVLKRAPGFSLSWATLIQSTPFHAISLTYFLILSSHPCLLCLPCGLFTSTFSTKIMCGVVPLHATCPAHLILLGLITWLMSGTGYKPRSFSLRGLLQSPAPSHLSSAAPILEHPQPVLFPHCQRPSFTPM